MPRPSSITPELLGEVAQRRAAGEPWKCISADLRARGLPHNRVYWWQVIGRDVCKRQGDCDAVAA